MYVHSQEIVKPNKMKNKHKTPHCRKMTLSVCYIEMLEMKLINVKFNYINKNSNLTYNAAHS